MAQAPRWWMPAGPRWSRRRRRPLQWQHPATPKPAATVVTRKPPRRWSVPGSLTSLGLLFMLATD
jgi:hypothetical protein